jgi:hypothetical protein
MPSINLAEIALWIAAGGLLAPLAGIGRQFGTSGAIIPAPRRRLNARGRMAASDLALAPRTIRLGAAAGSCQPSEANATVAETRVDGRSRPVGALRENRLSMRWQQDSDGALVMSWTHGAL